MVQNKYKVPKKAWTKWSPQARAIFNYMYASIILSQNVIAPRSIQKIPHKGWQVVCWNMAWLAADAVKDTQKGKEEAAA